MGRFSPVQYWPCQSNTLLYHDTVFQQLFHHVHLPRQRWLAWNWEKTRSNCSACTCKSPGQDRYVMLVLRRCRTFASFFSFEKTQRAKADRLKVVTQNICVILFGYLSVFGRPALLPASRCHGASISFTAPLQMCRTQSSGCQIAVSFWAEVHRAGTGSLILAASRSPRGERLCTGRGNNARGGLSLTVAFTAPWSTVSSENTLSVQHWNQQNHECESPSQGMRDELKWSQTYSPRNKAVTT